MTREQITSLVKAEIVKAVLNMEQLREGVYDKMNMLPDDQTDERDYILAADMIDTVDTKAFLEDLEVLLNKHFI